MWCVASGRWIKEARKHGGETKTGCWGTISIVQWRSIAVARQGSTCRWLPLNRPALGGSAAPPSDRRLVLIKGALHRPPPSVCICTRARTLPTKAAYVEY